MTDWQSYKEQRTRRVELSDGLSVLLRRPNVERALLLAQSTVGGLKPGYIMRIKVMRAAGLLPDKPLAKDAEEAEAWQRADAALKRDVQDDVRALTHFLLCEAAIEPQLYPTVELAEANGGMCVLYFSEEDIDKLELAVWELADMDKKGAEKIAPFRQPGNAGEAGGEMGQASA